MFLFLTSSALYISGELTQVMMILRSAQIALLRTYIRDITHPLTLGALFNGADASHSHITHVLTRLCWWITLQ